MILQELVDYYEALAGQGKISRPGWAPCNVSYALVLAEDGELLDVTPLLEERQQGKKAVMLPQRLELPAPVKRAVNISANFLWDNSSYLLGVDGKGKPQRTKDCFANSAQLHARVLNGAGSPAAKAVLGYFEKWNPDEAEAHPALAGHLDDIKKGANLTFRLGGSGFVRDDAAVKIAWQNHSQASEGAETAQCLVTGKSAAPARLHPSIKGVRDAQPAGASLVSFNADAYASYGKEQGMNSPVGEYAAFAYGTALNHLLHDRKHTKHLGDTSVVFWARGGQQAAQDFFATFLDTSDDISDNDLTNAMVKLSQGLSAPWGAETLQCDTPFFVLGLAPNAARLSVRFFLRNSLGAFAGHMLAHQERLEITRPVFDKRQQLSFWHLLQETVNQKSRDKTPSPVVAGELVRAVLSGGPYPATLLNGVTLRIRAEHEISRGRAAIVKAYYLRKKHSGCPEEVLTVQLNDSTHPPYRLGRAFAILESIQQAANPGLNATIKDKYFNAASATPATIFPTLINLTQKHLRKLEGGLRVHMERQLGEVLAAVNGFPTRLTLPEQGAFQLGYYHQTQKRYEKKEEPQNA